MKILLICGNSNMVISFRKELILFLLDKNMEVEVITGDSLRKDDIEKLGVKNTVIDFQNRSKNPFSMFSTLKKMKKSIRFSKPDIVFTFQIKPNILGMIAAKRNKIKNIYGMVEGLGDPFQPKNFKGKILRFIVSCLYKHSFRYAKKVFVLNNEDKNELVHRKIIKNEKLVVIPGIGIDTKSYEVNYDFPKEKTVLKLARLIPNKGIFDFCYLAREVHKTRPDIKFALYGEECVITKKDLEDFIDDGSIYYGGFSQDTKKLIQNSSLVVSCSDYREGFPRIILESMALGRVVVASNVIGNRDAIKNNETGFLVPAHDIKEFANKITEIIDDNNLLLNVAKRARNECENKYDSNIINSFIYTFISH